MNPSAPGASILSNLQKQLKKYKAQNFKLKKHISSLERENNLKNQQLDEKSKCIITCISENLRLKQQLEALKKRLNFPTFSAIANQTNKRCSYKKLGKRPKEIQLTKRYSSDSSPEENVSVCQMPYFMSRRSESVSTYSNVSEQACKLAFPAPHHQENSSGLLHLSPIEELTNEYSFSSPITVMSDCGFNYSFEMMMQSDNNDNIHENEWGASIATCSVPATPEPKAYVIPMRNMRNMKNMKPFHDRQVVSSDDEDLMSSITSMTPSYMSYDNNSENVIFDNKSVTVQAINNEDTNSERVNNLKENKSQNTMSIPQMEGSDSDNISIID